MRPFLFAAALILASVLAWADQPLATSRAAAATLPRALEQVRKLPDPTRAAALAAEVSQEGHWTFANAQGERFTAASAEELRRVVPTLLPAAATPPARVQLLVTEDSVFRQRDHFLKLTLGPSQAFDTRVVVDNESYPLLRRSDRLFALVRVSLLVELSDCRLFDEAIWQLDHPLRNAMIRILAVEPGGPASIAPSPRLDPQTKRPLTDTVAPAELVSALRSLRGQTVILTARRDGEQLAFRPASGADVTLKASDILAAAEAADVNLVILQSPTPRQPGSRSWMWQRVSVPRLDDAVTRTHLADFLAALAPADTRFLLAARTERPGRIGLSASPLRESGNGIADTLSSITSSIAGQVVVTGMEASLRDSTRQHELDRRIVAGIPAVVQWVYVGLFLLGIAGHGVGSHWWARIWPVERAEGYAGRLGYQLAEGVRRLVYALVFMPLAAPLSAPAALLSALRRRNPASV